MNRYSKYALLIALMITVCNASFPENYSIVIVIDVLLVLLCILLIIICKVFNLYSAKHLKEVDSMGIFCVRILGAYSEYSAKLKNCKISEEEENESILTLTKNTRYGSAINILMLLSVLLYSMESFLRTSKSNYIFLMVLVCLLVAFSEYINCKIYKARAIIFKSILAPHYEDSYEDKIDIVKSCNLKPKKRWNGDTIVKIGNYKLIVEVNNYEKDSSER